MGYRIDFTSLSRALRDDPLAAVLAIAGEGRRGKTIFGISRQEQAEVEGAANALLRQGVISKTQLAEVRAFLFHLRLPPLPPSPFQKLAAILTRHLGGDRRIERLPQAPTDEDAALAATWAGHSGVLDLATLSKIRPSDRLNRDLVRCLSARLAERFAAGVFEQTGAKVVDVSLTQLRSAEAGDWQAFDLLVDGRPVDVKNARSSFRNKDRYVEHCVPRFKRHRTGEVAIVGVLSPYVGQLPGLLSNASGLKEPLVFLGSVSSPQARDLEHWFSVPDLLSIDLGREGSAAHFIPPWLLTSPEHAAGVSKCAAELRSLRFPRAEDLGEEAARWLMPALLFDASQTLASISASHRPAELRFAKELSEATVLFGSSLPAVFLTVLRHFLTTAASGELWETGFNPLSYRKYLYFSGVEERPFGAYDPLRTISSLIAALSRISVEAQPFLRDFRSYRIVKANILQGRSRPGSHWKTVIAYCGGWDEANNIKCGTNPLVIGSSELCDECHRLRCHNCGHCSDGCVGAVSGTRLLAGG